MLYQTINGARVPVLGFGTWHLRGDSGRDAVRYAIDVGYRSIDTASRYENEVEVGQAIAASGLKRGELFVATKIRYLELEPDKIEARMRESLDRLGLDYVDLIMPHWPSPTFPIADVMKALRAVQEKGWARQVGMSNFPVAVMREAVAAFGAPLFGNQVEYHPYLDQSAVLAELRKTGMLLTACIPLARGAIEGDPVLTAIGAKYGKTVAQVTLRWLIQQRGVLAIPKSGQHPRIKANFEIFDFALDAGEMARIGSLRGGKRLVSPDWAPVVWDQPWAEPAAIV